MTQQLKQQLKQKALRLMPISALFFMAASNLSAQTLLSTTTPGVPSTALGGMLEMNIISITLSIAIIAIGTAIAYRMRSHNKTI